MKFHSKAFSSLSWLTLLVCLAVPFTASASTPSEIKLAWNANIEEDLAGYKIYYKSDPPSLKMTRKLP